VLILAESSRWDDQNGEVEGHARLKLGGIVLATDSEDSSAMASARGLNCDE